MIGTNDTGKGHGCPCGRSHPDTRPFRVWNPKPSDYARLRDSVYAALSDGKAEAGKRPGEHIVDYAKDCVSPLRIRKAADRGALHVEFLVQCRRCKPCLRRKMFRWAYAGVHQTQLAAEQGRRTWFGTLTLRPTVQTALLERAEVKWLSARSGSAPESEDWWSDPHCDFRFALVREEFIDLCQRYWKRLRKGKMLCDRCPHPKKAKWVDPRDPSTWDHPPLAFKYFLVFERHKSGLPHAHWLLHETGDPILKRHLQCEWSEGFTNVKLVRHNPDRPHDLRTSRAFYVAKYLGKTVQSRQIASRCYRPSRSRM